MTALRDLARAAGLDPDYTSWRGTETSSSDESLRAALQALAPELGIDVGDPGAIGVLERARWAELVPPVVVGWDGAIVVPFAGRADHDAEWELEVGATRTPEAGTDEARGRVLARASGRLFELAADSHAWPGGIVHCVRRARITAPLGYHVVRWRVGEVHGETFAICAPMLAAGGPGRGPRRWGVFAPVYGLANEASGEAGDLANLAQLFAAVARRGGSYVATLPILAGFLDEPCTFSPYSPASRLYWNELYVNLGALAAEAGMAAPVAPAYGAGLIDFRAQYRWRRAAFDPIASELLKTRASEIDRWAEARGAYDYAAFRAFGELARTGWRHWNITEAPRFIHTRAEAAALGADLVRVDSHVVAQWAMQRQLEELVRSDVGLYLDLPVGVNCDAYEVWRHRDLFLTTLSAGAPPDALFLGGQDWGLPPVSPIAQRRSRYAYFIACVRHHMQVAKMLRVDHVMGLFRLYCVPAGRPATDGVYVRYAADELLAILALESSRSGCALVGEDLGTVPVGVRPAMARHGLFRLHVGQWHLPAKVGAAPLPSPAESVASLNTHDTATFAGWWRGTDIDDRRELGLITETQDKAERVERADARAALLAFVGVSPLPELERAMVGATADLARGPAEVVLVALDDLALDPLPHNVPGTTTQRPNWQHRVASWDTALDADASPAAAAAIAAVVAARPR